jgi:hypothetical protein
MGLLIALALVLVWLFFPTTRILKVVAALAGKTRSG